MADSVWNNHIIEQSRVTWPHLTGVIAGGMGADGVRPDRPVCPNCGKPADYVYSFTGGRGDQPFRARMCPRCDTVAA